MSDHTATTTAEPAHAHAEAHDHEGHHGSMLSHVKPYLMVGAALFIFTVVTVALSYFDFADYGIFRWLFGKIGVHGMGINIVIGLSLATFKVCLVGAWFMHLKQEGGTIWRPLGLTFFFCFCLFMLFMLAHSDPIPTTSHPLH
jgi:caa(3)-type oxidase subunit IV